MRIFVTGMSLSMAENKSTVGYESLGPALVKGYEALHHTACQGPPSIETNDRLVRDFDVILMGIAPLDGNHSKYVIPCLDLLTKAREMNRRVIFYVSDWRTHELLPSLRSVLADPSKLVADYSKGRQDQAWGAEHLDQLVSEVATLSRDPWPTTIVPAHTWFRPELSPIGDHLNTRFEDLICLDPTVYTTALRPRLDPRTAPPRSWAWVLAALGDYNEWVDSLELVWPVRVFGDSKASKITESEVTQQYRECFGALVPMYPGLGPGPGWWRTRYHAGLRAGAVLLGHRAEMGLIGDTFTMSRRDMEALSPAQAHALSVAQTEQFVKQIAPEDRVKDTLTRSLRPY